MAWNTKNNTSWNTKNTETWKENNNTEWDARFLGGTWDSETYLWDDTVLVWDAKGNRKKWYNKNNTVWK